MMYASRIALSYGFTIACLVIVNSGIGSTNEVPRQLCKTTRVKCARRLGCGMALHNFYLGCTPVLEGKTGGCTKTCKQALISLLSTEDKQGSAFINCDCQGEKDCQPQKTRVEVCAKDVLAGMESINDNRTQLSCTLARWICEADTSCFVALKYYMEHCSEFFHGSPRHCSSRCNNSLNILYRQTRAKKLRNCRCDESSENMGFNCQQIKDNTERLCFHKTPPQRPSSDQPGEPLNPRDETRYEVYKKHNQSQHSRASSSTVPSVFFSSISSILLVLLTLLVIYVRTSDDGV